MTMETAPIIAMASINKPLRYIDCVGSSVTQSRSRLEPLRALFFDLDRRGNVHHRQNAKYVCLNQAGNQAEKLHNHRKEKRHNTEQDGTDDGAAHHVAKKSYR